MGLRYVVNNQGSLRDVLIRSSDPYDVGWAGIDIETWTIGGPALLKNVQVEGFDWGVRYGGYGHYSMVAEHLTLDGQRVGGIRNQGQVFSIRGLVTTNQTGPSVALFNIPGSNLQPSMVTLIDSSLSGAGAAAIEVNTDAGRVFVRDTTTTGYTHAINDQGTTIADVSNSEYVSGSGLALWTPAYESLRLPVFETPAPPASTEDRSLWVNVTNHDGNGPYFTPGSQTNPTWNSTNRSSLIQAAIDWAAANNRTTVYFPFGEYAIGNTIRIHGSVRRVVGNYSVIRTTQDARNVTDYPVFVFEDLDDSLFVEQINLYPGNQKKGIFFVNRSQHDVTIRNAYIGEGKVYLADGATGRLFLEDVAGLSSRYSGGVIHGHQPQFDFGNQQVWARQLNTEQDGLHMNISGGDLWVLGLKTEEPGTALRATGDARVEILGGLLLPSFSDNPNGTPDLVSPAFDLEDSAASITITTHSPFLNGTQRPYYETLVTETKLSETRTLSRADAPQRFLLGSNKSATLPRFTSSTAQSSIPLSEDPDRIAFWSFSNGPADDIGGHGGILVNGAQIVQDNGNAALSLDGVDSYLEVSSVPELLTADSFTVMTWVKCNTNNWGGYGFPISYRNVFIFNSSPYNKSIGALLRIDNSWKSISVNMNSETLSEWNHLAFTYENETVSIYWNGNLIASGQLPGVFTPSGNNPMYFGRDTSTRFFSGLLDDIQIWKRALSESEIQTLIEPRPVIDPDLVASWSFSNGPADEIGNHGGTLVNGAQIVQDNGNDALSLDGVDSYLEVSSVPALLTADSFTVMTWVKCSSNNWGGYGFPISYRNVFIFNSSPYNKSIGALLRIDNSWKSISVNMNNETLSEWNHLAFTYENETVSIYWNGNLIASGQLPGVFTPSGNNPMYFGRDTSTRFFSGLLDDIQIWKRALTQSEIQTLIAP